MAAPGYREMWKKSDSLAGRIPTVPSSTAKACPEAEKTARTSRARATPLVRPTPVAAFCAQFPGSIQCLLAGMGEVFALAGAVVGVAGPFEFSAASRYRASSNKRRPIWWRTSGPLRARSIAAGLEVRTLNPDSTVVQRVLSAGSTLDAVLPVVAFAGCAVSFPADEDIEGGQGGQGGRRNEVGVDADPCVLQDLGQLS